MNIYLYYLKKFFSSAKKTLLIGVILVLVFYSFIYFLNKDKLALNLDKNTNVVREQIYQTINDKELNSTKEGKLSILLYRSLNCSLIGEACTDNPSDGNENYYNSFSGFVGKLLVFPYTNPPASGIYWLADSLQKSGVIPNTYAAEGIGFASIKVFLPIWKIFRDFALLLLVVFLTLSGFMIMFRTKINPQTVITLENSLPRIVVSLLFIVFSFAIAGFLIDLMYIVTIIIVSQFSTLNIGDFFSVENKTELINKFVNPGLWELFPRLDSSMTFYGIGNAFYNILPSSIQAFLQGTIGTLGGIGFVKFISFFWKDLATALSGLHATTGGGFQVAGFGANVNLGGSSGGLPLWAVFATSITMIIVLMPYIASFLLSVFIFFSIFFVIVRIFIILLKTYIKILLLIIFSPIMLLLGALPGKNFIFSWIKNLSVNLFIFPIVTTLVLLSAVIAKINLDESANLWSAPYLYGLDPQALSTLIGVGILLVIPDLIKLLKEATGVKDAGISPKFFGAAASVGGGAWGGFNKYLSTRYYMTGKAGLPEGLAKFVGKIPGFKPPAEEEKGAEGKASKV